MNSFTEISPKDLDEFAVSHPYGNIHQSSKWAEFQSGVVGRGKALAYGVKDGDKLRAAGLFVRQELPYGLCWYFCPRGPLLSYGKPSEAAKEWGVIWNGLKGVLAKEKCVFLRVEWPVCEGKSMDFGQKAHAHHFPEHTLEIDLSASEEEILKQMKQKGRYNIKVATKHGVKIRKSKDAEDFWKIFKKTTKRDGFSGHSKKYYEDLLRILGDKAELFLAEYKEKVLAAAIVTYFGDTATYYFGASSDEDRNVMAPYLLHWEIVKDAKAKGCRWYDLFGVAPLAVSKGGASYDEKHPWAGVTGFKEKFGGVRVSYWPAQEKPLKCVWYWLVRLRKAFK